MSRKALITAIVSAVILIGLIAAAIACLYSGEGKSSTAAAPARFIEENELVKAVPSDAAIVLCFKDFGRACEYVCDSSTVFSQLLSQKLDFLMKGSYPDLRKAPAIMSVHYSKDMPPLLVLKAEKAIADTTADLKRLLAAADSSRLFHRTEGDMLIISSSETIVNSSARHISEGHSILEADGFAEMAENAPSEDVIFVSTAYSEKILEAYFTKKHRSLSKFVSDVTKWVAFSVKDRSDKGLSMHGELLYSNEPTYVPNILLHAGPGEVAAAEAVPSHTAWLYSIPVGNIGSYIKAYRNYLDAKGKLGKYESALRKQKSETGHNAETWAQALNIKEMATAGVPLGKDIHQVLLIKCGNRQTASGDFACKGFASTLFGSMFTASDESSCTVFDDWLVVGDTTVVKEYSDKALLNESLADLLSSNRLGDRVPKKSCGFWLYFAAGENPTLIDATFSPSIASALRKATTGYTLSPITLAAVSDGSRMSLEFAFDRANVVKSKAPAMADRDTTVTVPSGPFKVRNSGTGKDNTFYQNSYLSLCLRDENGKDLWGIPFKEKLCGYVQEVDYYNNGKIQFAFAAGSRLYLIDRLGRFVAGFPADLGKKIVLGPAIYDFTGAHGYSAMILHADNSIELYDLHGKKRAGWQGIKADETIKTLPELFEAKGTKYWIVRTSLQPLVYPFGGGEPLVKGEGEKMIRPDSKIVLNDKGLIVGTCYDGKERSFKIEKQ